MEQGSRVNFNRSQKMQITVTMVLVQYALQSGHTDRNAWLSVCHKLVGLVGIYGVSAV